MSFVIKRIFTNKEDNMWSSFFGKSPAASADFETNSEKKMMNMRLNFLVITINKTEIKSIIGSIQILQNEKTYTQNLSIKVIY